MTNKILLVDDEKGVVDVMKDYFQLSGYQVMTAYSGTEALTKIQRQPDIILLDINMPDIDGLTVCQTIREHITCPILFLTARIETADKIKGFSVGADDYIAKPFRPLELISRVKNVLRRSGRSRSVLRAGDLLVDTVKGTVTRDGQEIILSALEYRLLLVFLNRQGEVLTRNRLLEEIWDIAGDYVNDNTLTVYIKRLRDKIEKDPAHPEIIETVRGRGYRVG